jgi:hypothetical protein
MASTYKILGQSAPASTANVDIYTVASGKSAVLSTVHVANVTGTAATIQIYARIAGATAGVGNALAYNVSIAANSFLALTTGITLAATDVLTVQTATANAITFTVFGNEIS